VERALGYHHEPRRDGTDICAIYIRQYNLASGTPFGSGPLSAVIGRNGDTLAAKDLLDGTVPSTVLSSLLSETVWILHALAKPQTSLPGDTQVLFKDVEVIATYKEGRENTSFSPSGHHIGHCKAIIKDATLVSLHTAMMSIPFQAGFAPARWTKVSDIMLEKEPGNSRCNRLRILALFKNDFNQSKWITIARKVSRHIEDQHLVSDMQFGSRPGRNCHSAVLQKVLSHDTVCITRTTASFLENNIIGCNDRLMNNLLLIPDLYIE
jgi:hypothetical protein